MTSGPKLETLIRVNAQVLIGAGERRVERQHSLGKRTARERYVEAVEPAMSPRQVPV